jgi:hypothetical protein
MIVRTRYNISAIYKLLVVWVRAPRLLYRLQADSCVIWGRRVTPAPLAPPR